MTLTEIHNKAREFQNTIHRRNVREYIGACFALVFCSTLVWFLPSPAQKLGAALLLAGISYVTASLRATGSAREVPVEDCLGFHRRELVRQRDLLRDAGTWHLAAILPGVLLLIGSAWTQSNHYAVSVATAATAALTAAVLGLVSWLNLRAARRLDERVRSLSGQ
jgi:hypothetical protein